MASTSETGHAKNVANFQDLNAVVTGYGAVYNPSKVAIQLANLLALFTTAAASLAQVITTNALFNNSVNVRMIAFEGLRSLCTRVINALEATDATEQTIKDARTIINTIMGRRAKPVPVDPNQPAPNTISVSQQSYDQLIQHFEMLIALVENEPLYNPNETDLKVVNLKLKLDELKAANADVFTHYTTVSNARIDRNKVLYLPSTGLVDTAEDVKSYAKSVFGARSPEFALINHIKFRGYKI